MTLNYIATPAYRLVEEFKEDPDKIYSYIESIYQRIRLVEERILAYITLRSIDEVFKDIDRVVENYKKSKKRSYRLFGIAIAVKDNISTKGIRTTCASKILENYVPPYDATVIERLKYEGAIVIGKTNMDEFAMGSTTENSAFFPTRNPWDTTRVPGGSSGGSAAALAAGEATLALGSDTGGSIRCPAAFTATYGLKPTYGLVSRYGLVAYASSLDQIGPMARNTIDLAMLLTVIAGHDPRDSTSLRIAGIDYVKELKYLVGTRPKLRLGILKELVEVSEEPIQKVFMNVVDRLCTEHTCNYISIPYPKQILAAYYIVAMAEASSNLARYDGVRYGIKSDVNNRNWVDVYTEIRTKGFGYEVKKRVALGAYILSAGYRDMYYLKALRIRRMLKEYFNKVFNEYDLVLSPTMPVLPPRLGEMLEDPLKMYFMDINTVIANLIGAPAISIPIGFVQGLPVGLQAMSKPLNESILLYFSYIVEELQGIHDMVAPV